MAFIEMLGAYDSRQMRRLWVRRWKYKDVSPIWGSSGVRTFRGTWNSKVYQKEIRAIEQWSTFNKAMESIDADWYYISGHHGRQFANDWTNIDDEIFVGFFNEFYHDNRWSTATKSTPLDGLHEHGVYMKSTLFPIIYGNPAGGGALFDANPHGPESNPVFTKERTSCKGALLIACNTLSYRHSRLAWHAMLPNAVVIGKTWTCSGGKKSWKPIKKVLGRNPAGKAFFQDPANYFANKETPKELCERLNKHYSPRFGYGIMWRGKLYHKPDRSTAVKEMDIHDSF